MTRPDPEFVAFLKEYPTYPTTHIIDDLRSVEYARLDLGGHVYLDFTGGGVICRVTVAPSSSSAV